MDGTDLMMSASRIVAGGQLQRQQWESWNWKFMFSCKQLVSSEHCFMERAGWVGEEGGIGCLGLDLISGRGDDHFRCAFCSFYAHGKGNLTPYHAEGTAVHRPAVLEGGLGGKGRARECGAYA